MDDLVTLIPAEWQAYLLFAITATTLAMPLLEWIANKTANTWDNALVARLAQFLALVPRVGLGNRQKAGETIARVSRKPPPAVPPVAIVLLLALPLVASCAGTPEEAARNRMDANALREQVNAASDALEQAHGALPFVCAYLGPESSACTTLEDTYRVLATAVDTSHRGIDLLDAVGIGGEQLRESAARVLSESQAFGASVARLGNEVANALERHRQAADPDRTSHEAGPEAAPAEDAGQAPAAAP